MADRITTQPVKGTRDFYPEDMRRQRWLFDSWRAVALRFGYEEYDACVLESEELYVRKAGDEITDQLYNFRDKGDRAVALRPEMTPSLARMVMARAGSLAMPLRWFSIPQCFRYERMQRGRKREHYQWNMDLIGLDSVAAEVELMAAQVAFLEDAGLELRGDDPEVRIRLSNRTILQGVLADLGITDETFAAVCVIIDKRDKIGRAATADLLAEAGIAEAIAGRLLDLLDIQGIDDLVGAVGRDNPGVVALERLLDLAAAAGVAHLLAVDLGVVRGLSYYTGTVWELFDTRGAMRAIAGGGRYDHLMETLGGKPLPMVGFGFGDVVIVDLLDERGLLPQSGKRVDDVVYPMQEGGFAVATALATALRARGRRVEVDYTCRRFKHAIKAAELAGAEQLYILGESELQAGRCTVRTLGAERVEREVAVDTLIGGTSA